MDLQDSDTGDDEEVLLFVPSTSRSREESAVRYRSRMTRDSDTCLRIDIPCRGLTATYRRAELLNLGAFLSLVVFGAVFLSSVLGPIYLLLIPVGLVLSILIQFKIWTVAGTETELTITRSKLFLTRKQLKWEAIIKMSSSRELVGRLVNDDSEVRVVSQSRSPRLPSLEAKVISHAADDSKPKYIKLGRFKVGHGLIGDEVEWLAEEINCFLRETSKEDRISLLPILTEV